ncbi:hypothetical protein BDV96DRAFT_636546 [Lophiotrema nucula]|uniref:Uncharacterized protein n=1 Tax=Lophiotrema nucula TaxID=690887 RepID=A0A6A5YNY3_9PLEO|nr:hypothetical protein BDV96DRAFT_636546 [Lophiotrema nucula]
MAAPGHRQKCTAVDRALRRDLSTWTQLGSTLGNLEELRVLRVWLDHDKSCTWTVVNERAILAPLTQFSSTTNINISLSLPKLHPRFERDDYHFISTDQTPFNLHRRVRQRFHVLEDLRGDLQVLFKPDFPEFYTLVKDVMPSEEAEELERDGWRRGLDIGEIIDELAMHLVIFDNLAI